MGLWQQFKKGLHKTSEKIEVVFRSQKLDEEVYEDLEDAFIMSDVGSHMSHFLVSTLVSKKPQTVEEAKQILLDLIIEKMQSVQKNLYIDTKKKPFVFLMVGVNGTGKTTSIGKLAAQFQSQGLKVSMAAADTFRMAAIEQLQEWGKKINCPVYAGEIGSDPASIAYEALLQAQKQQDDVLFIDTAGRLQNKKDLMDELKKIDRVLKKIDPEAPHITLLSLDATVGQNAISQVEEFNKLLHLDGLIMTKLDGTAKGGILLCLTEQFKIPTFYIGVGEKTEDLLEFDLREYAKGLLGIK